MILRVLAVAGLLIGVVPGAVGAQTAAEVMLKHRQVHQLQDEEERHRLTLVSKSGATKERTVVRYTLSGADHLDKILIRFLAPREVESTALLTWERKNGADDQWLYLPATRKPKRIAASGKKNRFMGTDFTYEDLRPESISVNTYTLAGAEGVDGQECFVVDSVPASERLADDSGYSKRKLWVRKDNFSIVKREYYDKAGKLEKIEVSRKLVNVKGTAWRADEVEMRDVQNGTRTTIVVERRKVEQGLKDDFFTEAELTR